MTSHLEGCEKRSDQDLAEGELEIQRPDGSWPRQAVNGVFFGTAMLDYRLYHCYFPAWALARHASLAPPAKR